MIRGYIIDINDDDIVDNNYDENYDYNDNYVLTSNDLPPDLE